MKILYKISITVLCLMIPFGIYVLFGFTVEKYLNEFVLINSGTHTTGNIIDYQIEKETVENEQTHKAGILNHYICQIEFPTEQNSVINEKVDIDESDFQKLKDRELNIVYLEKNPKIFQILNSQKLLTKSEWFWKRFTLIMLIGFSTIASICFAFYKGYKYDY